MPVKEVNLPDIGKVKIYKRRGTRHIRLSLHPENYVRVTMPTWLPYRTAIDFVRSKAILISQNRQPRRLLSHNMKIGKNHQLTFAPTVQANRATSKIIESKIVIKYPATSNITSFEVQKTALRACLKVLKNEAELTLRPRINQLAARHGYAHRNIRLRYLKSRWGSCSSMGDITLNTMLLTLPWNMVDHVIVHELLHTKFMSHGPDFWSEFEKAEPGAKKRQKLLKQYQPHFH